MPTLTVEQARNGAMRSVQVRREQKQELEMLRIRVAMLEASKPVEHLPEPSEVAKDMLKRTREQLDDLDRQLDSCDDPKAWDALTRAKERQFRIWARLAQLPSDPKPVALKPAQSRPSTVQPIGPAPQAVVVAPKPEQP